VPARTEIDSDPVHVVEAEPGRKAGRARSSWVGGLLLLAAAGAGAWVLLTDPFAGRTTVAAPPPATGNLLADGWSFETSESSSPSQAWRPAEEAPRGFDFGPRGAVSGEAGASAEPGEQGWARVWNSQAVRLPPGAERVQFSATSQGDALQLLLRWEAEDQPALEHVLASGSGRLVGVSRPPPGYTSVRAGLGCAAAAAVDDLDLRCVSAAEAEPPHGMWPPGGAPPGGELAGSSLPAGVFEVRVGDPRGLSVFRTEQLVLRVQTATVRLADGRSLPASAALLPGSGELALADGTRVRLAGALQVQDRRLVLSETLGGLPPGTVVVHPVLVAGSLASAPIGIRSARGFERFSGDFRVEGVDALLLGTTQDRLALEMGLPFTAAASHRSDGSVALSLEQPAGAGGEVQQQLLLQAEFQEERVVARQALDAAQAAERQGQLGAALREVEHIASESPYDEAVLGQALALRAAIEARMQQQLDALDADLEDALFLGSASRCREVREAALAGAALFAGSSAEAAFEQRAATVEARAARLLAEDVDRRRQRLTALAESFAAHGGFPRVAAELQEALARDLPPPEPAAPAEGTP